MARVDGHARQQLIDAGVRLLEQHGRQALQARKVAAEVGASTMAVYTHFGGMTGLIDAIAGEAFARFARALTEVPQTDDPVADFAAMGIAYRRFALANPQRYQLIFGIGSPGEPTDRPDLTVTRSTTDRTDQAASFEALVIAVRRMIAAGRIRDDGELPIAGRIWSVIHGAVTLELAGFFGHEGHGPVHVLGPMMLDLLVGMGDDRAKATQSMIAAVGRSKSGDAAHPRSSTGPA
jgi:AcrR family transcriptional regulator